MIPGSDTGEVKRMGIIEKLERVFGTLIEGFFRRKIPRRIQPIEIGRALIVSLDKNKQVSMARTYAPNHYVIYLHGEDLAHIQCVAATLTEELKGVLRDKAERDKLSFVGDLELEFKQDDSLTIGASRIESSFHEDTVSRMEEKSYTELDTRVFHITNPKKLNHNVSSNAWLVVQSNAASDRVIQMMDGLTVGRGPSCHLRLQDSNVSRVHARFYRQKGSWVISDNHSTNGTFVNEEPTTGSVLRHGDKIQIGTTILIFNERN